MDRRLAIVLLTLLFILPSALAADPGHPASSIGQGIFETGNFTFNGNFSVGGGGTLWAFLNNATGNLGLGTTLPTHKLQVEGNTTINGNFSVGGGGTLRLFVDNSTPAFKLNGEVSGVSNLNLTDISSLTNYITGPAFRAIVIRTADANDANDEIGFEVDTNTADPGITYTRVMSMDWTGNVGIGQTNPLSKLEVVGNTTINGNFSVGSPNNVTFFVNNASRTVGIGGVSNISRLTIAGGSTNDGGFTSSLRLKPIHGEDYPSIYFGNQSDTQYSAIIWTNNTGDVRCNNCRLAQLAISPANASSSDLTFSTNPDAGRSGPAARMTIPSYGGVGIGTATPGVDAVTTTDLGGTTLQLQNDVNYANLLVRGDLANIQWADSGGGAENRWIWAILDGGVLSFSSFYDNGTIRRNNITTMAVDTGNVGIGTTAPLAALHVNGADDTTQIMAKDDDGNPTTSIVNITRYNNVGGGGNENQSALYILDNGGNYPLHIAWQNGTPLLSIKGSGNIITGPGRVGIGTASPAYALDVSGGSINIASGQYLRGAGTAIATSDGSTTIIGTTNNVDLRFDAGGASRMFIDDSTGNVGIGSGETNPATTLEVNGTIRAIRTISILNTIDVASGASITSGGTYGGLNITTDSGLTSGPSFSVITYQGGDSYQAALTVTAARKLAVNSLAAATANTLCYDTTTVNGMNTLSTCSSSRRYKENIKPLIVDKDKVFQLQPVSFKWKNKTETSVGLIAEDVEPVIPELVGYYNGQIESVEYKLLTVYLLDIVKKQDKTIQELDEENLKQQQEIDELKKAG